MRSLVTANARKGSDGGGWKIDKNFESKQNETSHSDKLQETATITQKAVESTINNNNSNRTEQEKSKQ